MDGFTIFMLLVMVTSGLLYIILFFKVWGMTNNVKKLADKFVTTSVGTLSSNIAAEYTAKRIVCGNEKAQESLRNSVLLVIENVLKSDTTLCSKDKAIETITKICGIYMEKAGISLQRLEEVVSERFPDEYNGIKCGDTVEFDAYGYTCLGFDTLKRVFYLTNGEGYIHMWSFDNLSMLKKRE